MKIKCTCTRNIIFSDTYFTQQNESVYLLIKLAIFIQNCNILPIWDQQRWLKSGRRLSKNVILGKLETESTVVCPLFLPVPSVKHLNIITAGAWFAVFIFPVSGVYTHTHGWSGAVWKKNHDDGTLENKNHDDGTLEKLSTEKEVVQVYEKQNFPFHLSFSFFFHLKACLSDCKKQTAGACFLQIIGPSKWGKRNHWKPCCIFMYLQTCVRISTICGIHSHTRTHAPGTGNARNGLKRGGVAGNGLQQQGKERITP